MDCVKDGFSGKIWCFESAKSANLKDYLCNMKFLLFYETEKDKKVAKVGYIKRHEHDKFHKV